MKTVIIATVLIMASLAHASMDELNKAINVDCAGVKNRGFVQMEYQLLSQVEQTLETSTQLTEEEREVLKTSQHSAIKNVATICTALKERQ